MIVENTEIPEDTQLLSMIQYFAMQPLSLWNTSIGLPPLIAPVDKRGQEIKIAEWRTNNKNSDRKGVDDIQQWDDYMIDEVFIAVREGSVR